MQADRGDRIDSDRSGGRTGGRHSSQTLLISIAVIILAAGAYLIKPKEQPAPVVEKAPEVEKLEPPEPVVAAAVKAAPDIPEPVQVPEEITEPEALPEPEPEPPTQDELDQEFRDALADAGVKLSPSISSAASAPFLLDRSVSAVDQVARGYIPYRALNITRPTGEFATQRSGSSYRIDPQSYSRYNVLVSAIAAVPIEGVASFFHRFRSQLSGAYAQLGYPAEDLDNALIAALDAVRSAPVADDPPSLVSKGALWAYADPALESASDVHKQLLRSGPENTRSLQAWATRLREELLKDGDS